MVVRSFACHSERPVGESRNPYFGRAIGDRPYEGDGSFDFVLRTSLRMTEEEHSQDDRGGTVIPKVRDTSPSTGDSSLQSMRSSWNDASL